MFLDTVLVSLFLACMETYYLTLPMKPIFSIYQPVVTAMAKLQLIHPLAALLCKATASNAIRPAPGSTHFTTNSIATSLKPSMPQVQAAYLGRRLLAYRVKAQKVARA